jgi:hypothetical protein
MHASLVWSDLNAAAIIRGAVHLLHHVFLTILFGIFRLLPIRPRDCRDCPRQLSRQRALGPAGT